jgi:cyanophycin synthetase
VKIESIRAFTGANVYSHRPVLMMQLDLGELQGTDSRELEGFNARLLELLPGLSEHHCNLGKPGGFIRKIGKWNAFKSCH